MSVYWDCGNTSIYWEIERQLKKMLESNRHNCHSGIIIDSVEAISINKDSTADVDLYGRDEISGLKGHYHIRLKLYPGGTFVIMNCQKK
ncbi:hypothetical protein IJS18_01475 [Candidatus Saccharibacteria bacterium]|nr:hypothetical protein [Candidatus Saccharibacteria bacterium]